MLASKLIVVIYFTLFYGGHMSPVNAINIVNPFTIHVAETNSNGTCPSTAQRAAVYQNITNIVQTSVSEYICEHIDTKCLSMNCGPGEWRQVAFLNMSNPSQQCPSTWREYSTSGVRACRRPDIGGGSCAGVSYSSNNEQYNRVCGRAIGYQVGSTDGFGNSAPGHTIESYYVYGVSFTHGMPRTHIWTLAAGLTQNSGTYACCNCPCTTPTVQVAPSFIGNDYYCESGNPTDAYIFDHVYSEDPLWDGEQCEGQCCSNGKSPPWFSVELPNPTSDDIEVRICCPQASYDDILIQLLEIYVQ